MEPGSTSYNAAVNSSGDHCDEMEHPYRYQPPFGNVSQGNHQQPGVLRNFRKRKTRDSSKQKSSGTRGRKWKDEEISALLKLVNLPEFRPRRGTQCRKANWELIAEEMQKSFGADGVITTIDWKKRCMEKMKTLTGDRYYKHANLNWDILKKERDNLTEEDWHKTIEACGLTVEWYEAIKEYIQGPCEDRQGRRQMQRQQCGVDPNVTTNCPSSLHIPMVDGPAEPVQTMGGEKRRKSEVGRQSFAQQFKSLNNLQRSTLLDLYFAASGYSAIFNEEDSLSDLCRKLSIVQNRRELSIYEDVIALEKKGLVMWINDDEMDERPANNDEVLLESTFIDYDRLLVHKRFFEKVMQRHPIYNTFQHFENVPMVTFEARFGPLGITMLALSDCEELEVVDLSGFEKLRVLIITGCPKLHKVIGCEDCFIGLRWLEIYDCPSYDGYSSLRIFPYLQEFYYCPYNYGFKDDYRHVVGGGELDVSGCVYLRRLRIYKDAILSSILGLEGLHFLIELKLWNCKAVHNLPNIGHMKHLTHLNVSYTAVEEIKGIEKLWSLKELDCFYSKLKMLGDLNHLPHLKVVDVHGCPVTKDPSSPFFGKGRVEFNHKTEDVDVSDVSETEQDVSCEGS